MSDNKDFASILAQAFDKTLESKFGASIPPPPYVTPFGIRTLDTILGGGLTSSAPVAFSSTPETGKSTCALQFCAAFQVKHPDSVIIYLDAESAAGGESKDIEDRIATFGINKEKFLYKPIIMDLKQTFAMLQEMVQLKTKLQERVGKEIFVLFILDSIAAVPSSKDASAEDVNEVIGYKARELTFELNKNKQFLSMNRISFIVIDQVRANMQIKSSWQAATDEQTVGTFGNFKSATNVSSLQHNIRQWLWLSKGSQLKSTDPLGVDGWILNVSLEKNKLAPSKYSIPLVFDKKYGAIPILSEYYFLSEKTKTEKKLWPDKKALLYPLCITGPTNKRVLEVYDPNTGEVQFTSAPFNERNFITLYNTDEIFRGWFDYAVWASCEVRIKRALFRDNPAETPQTQSSELIADGEEVIDAEPSVDLNEENIDEDTEE